MKILVTGGAGFIGSHLVDAYLERKNEVIIVDDLSSGSKENIQDALKKGAKLYEIPLQSPKLRDILKEERPQLINHHAAQKSVRDSVVDPLKDADINLIGFLNLLEGARAVNCRQLIFASSGGVVYGEQEVFPANEQHSKRPLSPYGVSKLASELYLDFYCYQWKMTAVALRYANVYGPRQDPLGEAGVVAIFCEKMIKSDPTIIYGSGRQTRDFVYVADVIQANLMAEKYFQKGGSLEFKAFNVGTSVETSVLTLHQKLAKIAEYQQAPRFERERSGEQLRSNLSFSALNSFCQWNPVVSLDLGLRKTFDWFRSRSAELKK